MLLKKLPQVSMEQGGNEKWSVSKHGDGGQPLSERPLRHLFGVFTHRDEVADIRLL